VNTVRDIEKIFEFLADVNNMSEWINLYAPIYYGASAVNGADDIIFEEKYSISIKRAARETVTEI
jgi:hypothetical protein